MVQTLFGKDISFSVRTFRFAGGHDGDQEQTITCQLHLEPVGDVPEEQASECTCFNEHDCAGQLFR